MTLLAAWAPWYLGSIVIVWAAQIVYDYTTGRQARLQPQIYYVAVSLIWPLVAGWVLALLTLAWWRKHQTTIAIAVRELWHSVQQLRKAP